MTNYEKGLEALGIKRLPESIRSLGVDYQDVQNNPSFAWQALGIISKNYGINFTHWFDATQRAVSLTRGVSVWNGHGPDIGAALYAAIECVGEYKIEDGQ